MIKNEVHSFYTYTEDYAEGNCLTEQEGG